MGDHPTPQLNFQLGNELGRGNFGVVYQATGPSGEVVAIKRQKCTNQQEHLSNPYFKEAYLMALVNTHPHIVRFLGHFFSHDQRSNLIMEYIPRAVTLMDLLEGKINHFAQYFGFPTKEILQDELFHFGEAEIWVLIQQLVLAITRCHEMGICHRDIKPENILLTLPFDADPNTHSLAEVVVAKLCDFGLADFIPPVSKKFTTHPGSLTYAAPELLRGIPYDGPKAELWSLGVMLYMMTTGYHPFGIQEKNNTRTRIIQGKVNYTRLKFPAIEHILRLIFQTNPDERIDFSQFKTHPWFIKGSDCKDTDLTNFDELNKENKTRRCAPAISFPSLSFLPHQCK